MTYDGANIKALRQSLEQYNLRANKRLGQNFLCDANVADAIVKAAGDLEGVDVLEIGPGAGALTVRLAQEAKRVTAVEIDAGLFRLLNDKIDFPNVTLLHADALKVPLEDLGLRRPAVLVANLPYYITTPLMLRYLSECREAERFVLMMQKEVAQRLQAKPGSAEYGSLSIAVRYYAEVRQAFSVSANCFYPKPEVSSSVAVLTRREPPIKPKDESTFFLVVQTCFAMRRKTILNNLLTIRNLNRQGAERALVRSGIDGAARGETLSFEQFAALSDAVGDEMGE